MTAEYVEPQEPTVKERVMFVLPCKHLIPAFDETLVTITCPHCGQVCRVHKRHSHYEVEVLKGTI